MFIGFVCLWSYQVLLDDVCLEDVLTLHSEFFIECLLGSVFAIRSIQMGFRVAVQLFLDLSLICVP